MQNMERKLALVSVSTKYIRLNKRRLLVLQCEARAKVCANPSPPEPRYTPLATMIQEVRDQQLSQG